MSKFIVILEKGELSIDTETTSLDPHQAKLVGISFFEAVV